MERQQEIMAKLKDMENPTPSSWGLADSFMEHLKCSICLDMYNDPVSTRCGHNFCKSCLDLHLHYNDQNCPLCKAFLYRDFTINVGLKELVLGIKKVQERRPQKWSGKEGDVPCDVCVKEKFTAVKSCLVCLASYCQEHVKMHAKARRLHGHKLVAPMSDLDTKACLTHGRPLELYCYDEQRCVCALCVQEGHNVGPAEAEWERKKEKIESFKDEMQQKIKEREQKVDEIIQSVQLCTTHIDRETKAIQDVFDTVLKRVQQTQDELLRPLQKKKETMENELLNLTAALQNEIRELKKKINQLDSFSKDQDHIHFLQSFSSLPSTKEYKDWTSVSVDTHLSLGTMRAWLSFMMEQIRQETDRLTDLDLERIQKFAADVTLDPTTANPQLILSEDRREVTSGDISQDLPDNPHRFDVYGSVLGHEELASGRHYWEVDVGDKSGWDLGVTGEFSSRKGLITFNPQNSYWVLVLYNENRYAALADSTLHLSLRFKPTKVGVYVDYEEGEVSFYDVEHRSHIYTFTGNNFTEKLYPYFSPHLSQNSKNSAPLIITPVLSSAS